MIFQLLLGLILKTFDCLPDCPEEVKAWLVTQGLELKATAEGLRLLLE